MAGCWRAECLRCGHVTPWKRYLMSQAISDAAMHLDGLCHWPGEEILDDLAPMIYLVPLLVRAYVVACCESCERIKPTHNIAFHDSAFSVCEACFPCETRENVGN